MVSKACLSLLLALTTLSGGAAAEQAPPWQTIKEPAQLVQPTAEGRQRVGDVELHYAVYGKGRPVIFLHDSFGNSTHWGNQVGPLSLDYQVIVIDARGHGRSTRGDKPFSYHLMAEDVFGLMRKKGWEDATIVGWGDGAVVGLDLAMRHPGWVRKLVMFGGNHDLSGLKPGAEKTPTFVAYSRKAIADYQQMSPAPDFERLFADLRAMWSKEPAYDAADLRKVKAPVTIMLAEHEETVLPNHMRRMAELIPNGQLIMLPSVSHFAPWQDSRQFNRALALAVAY